MLVLAAFQLQRFGGGGDTYVHPVVAAAVLCAAGAMLLLPRKGVLTAFLAGALLIPMDQVLVVGGLHFQMLRILILFGWIRLLLLTAGQNLTFFRHGWNAIDKALVLMTVLGAIDLVLLWQSSAVFVNQLGTVYTAFGAYFLLRFLIRDTTDVVYAIRSLAYVSVVVAIVMVIEQITRHNPYAYVWAGAWTGSTVMERDGHLRAMGCFAHPLLAGTFGGISLPLFIALWRKGNNKRMAAVGMVASTLIVLTANSSTPLLAYFGGLVALCFWPFRKQMRVFRWGLVSILVVLHLAMKAPVWALIARIDLTGSSSGYHRYQLVDQFIRRFGDWWLLGTRGNASWGWDMWDLANQYVAVGETSGLFPFLCFVALIVCAFKYCGRTRRSVAGDPRHERFVWAIGAALFANIVAFFGISYFDQTMVAWYLLLAIIGAVAASTAPARKKVAKFRIEEEPAAVLVGEAVLAGAYPRVSDLS